MSNVYSNRAEVFRISKVKKQKAKPEITYFPADDRRICLCDIFPGLKAGF